MVVEFKFVHNDLNNSAYNKQNPENVLWIFEIFSTTVIEGKSIFQVRDWPYIPKANKKSATEFAVSIQ
jgi:hypothetical protein